MLSFIERIVKRARARKRSQRPRAALGRAWTLTLQEPVSWVGTALALGTNEGQGLHFGGAEEDRTPDPLRARQVLSQLSYGPVPVAPTRWRLARNRSGGSGRT